MIRTSKLALRYVARSGPFTSQNLSVDLMAGACRAITARPTWPGTCAYGQGCEAESLALTGGASDHKNYTGSGFVAGLKANSRIAWTQTLVPADGDYLVQFRYANSEGGDGRNTTRTISVTVGSSTSQVSLPVTGSWDTWRVATATVHLLAGSNPLALACGQNNSCNVNVDSVAVTAPGATYLTPTSASALGGWRRSLDGQSGPAPLLPGLLSRDGSYLLDDTQTAILNPDQSITARPSTAAGPTRTAISSAMATTTNRASRACYLRNPKLVSN